ncbi:MAG TPA: peptide-methionine (R)-S-oxide reductase [Acidimicrobiaceae bacterium]|nr:peptide-methionine (R)-S-oxide reductase [Acidimicrobiaceae bacterium]HAX05040.1 peptide-methionine (R)-S-oxide reductase [Acidimicrobiaceae bacterium]|tara:strand:- start:45 stop:452 length:408 start_codon:yes stop_codon:yes gene_type:complete
MSDRSKTFTEDDLRARLTPLQYHVTQEAGTEQAFTGDTWDQKQDGLYRCVVCDTDLFSSDSKYESGSGWPSFWQPLSDGAVDTKVDTSHGMVRVEALCQSCGAHLGHVFPDGPDPTGDRYCMNSASMQFDPQESE